MWSEHCSYKSSRVHLKRLPTRSKRVVQGPGENAGIIDMGDGWACAFKIESHNHPSAHRAVSGRGHRRRRHPARHLYHGRAAPGGDGFAALRADCTRQSRSTAAATARVHKNHSILEGVVSGIASYGNCFGVPNLGGETKFEPCYSGNPLVNAFALGLVRKDEIFYAQGRGRGQSGDLCGREDRPRRHSRRHDGQRRVQRRLGSRSGPMCRWAIRFMEKLLLEACLEAMQTGAVVGIQDMGAAGLTCSTCEMGARGGVGLEIELDLVPQRETGMTAYEIMLSANRRSACCWSPRRAARMKCCASSRSGDWTL